MADNHTKEARSYNMSRIRSKESAPEVLVRKYLFAKGLRFRKNDRRYSGCPDIVLPKYKAIIFVHGCFWHMHANCSKFVMPKSNTEYWKPKLIHNREKDQKNYEVLKTQGWRIFVVWECQLSKEKRDITLNSLYLNIINLDSNGVGID